MTDIQKIYEAYTFNPVVITDTRSVIPGSIFFALKGQNFNGNAFAEKALELGASYVVVDEKEYVKSDRYFLVEDVLTALQKLANYHRKQLNIPFLAITGSNGKTTTKELIRNVLSKRYKTIATKGNLNNHIGVPLTILSIPNDAEFAVIEMGANHRKEIESYCIIAEPDYGLITNVGKAHLEGFGGFKGVKKGKGELYDYVAKNGKAIFINADNPHLIEMVAERNIQVQVKYGADEKLYCSGWLVSDKPTLSVGWKCGYHSGHINTNLIGAYNFENILSAVCIGNYFKVEPKDIDDAIAAYNPDNSRSQVIIKGTNTIILDAYNANPTSMEAALNNFSKIDSANKIIFLGEMAELGEESEAEHKALINRLAKNGFEKIILVGNKFEGFNSELNYLHFSDSSLAAQWLKENPVTNANILIKGSRSTKMEKILDSL
jgi:UDP-N-acetylmuramoyl-tripeptide--D-alanyl-D-alanine ligase